MTRTTPIDPLSSPSASRVKPLLVAWTASMDNIVPALLAHGAEIVKWPSDIDLSFVRREEHSFVDQFGHHFARSQDVPRNVASALIRRRSQQLCLDFRVFRNFCAFSAVWACRSDGLMLQLTHHPEISEFQRLLPHRVSINVGRTYQVVLTSHQQLLRPLQREATRNAMATKR